jgi:glycine betaine/choline ABC-type transport system substrate-binding protein
VFHQDVPHESAAALERARQLYAGAGLTMMTPLGFNNTFAILVRGEDARSMGLQTIEDLGQTAGRWTPGFGYEFLQREDGYPGLLKTYALRFAHPPRAMDLSLIYRALADHQVDVVAGDRTSALIDALDLAVLNDNRRYFPPYDAVPVARSATILKRPEVGRAIDRLARKISDAEMRRMNAAVDVDRRDVVAVAREFVLRAIH